MDPGGAEEQPVDAVEIAAGLPEQLGEGAAPVRRARARQLLGELVRAMMQFKSFAIGFSQRVLARRVYAAHPMGRHGRSG